MCWFYNLFTIKTPIIRMDLSLYYTSIPTVQTLGFRLKNYPKQRLLKPCLAEVQVSVSGIHSNFSSNKLNWLFLQYSEENVVWCHFKRLTYLFVYSNVFKLRQYQWTNSYNVILHTGTFENMLHLLYVRFISYRFVTNRYE